MKRNPLADELELSIRAYNALNRAGITTVDKLVSTTLDDLLNIKGLGRRTLNELRDVVSEEGFGLRWNRELKRERKNRLKEQRRYAKIFSPRKLYIFRERVLNKRTLKDVAIEIGITKERVRQIINTLKEKSMQRWAII